jgi:GNAT superfamily N-acetyltransferase
VRFEIREVDAADEDQLRRWWATGHEAMAGRPYDLRPTWETMRAITQSPHPDFEQTLLAAYDGEEMVGAAMQMFPVADNLTMSYADVTVPSEHRRRGVGSALLNEVEGRARAAGRAYVLVEVLAPVGVVGPGELFAGARGYPVANREGIKVLDLADHPDWSPLEQKVVERLGGYRVAEWGAFTPDEHLGAVCDALNLFVGMIPTGDIALEDTKFTPDRLRRNEERWHEVGRRRLVAVAFAPDGTLAGYSDLFLQAHVDHYAQVGITMVLPEHRGHALGLAMKLATHASLVEAAPTCGLVTTSNADVNEQMNAVNEQMGYRLVEQLLEVQKTL